jgi:hypothetical protein
METLVSAELEVAMSQVTDVILTRYLENFLKDSSVKVRISMKTPFQEINYNMKIVNPRARILKLMSDWTTVSSKYNLESPLVDKKGKKV